MRTYYALWYRLNGKDSYLLWYDHTGSREGVELSPDGSLLTFSTYKEVLEHTGKLKFAFGNEEPILHDLDVTQNWLQQPSADDINCNDFLAAWNLFVDVAYSALSEDYYEKTPEVDRIYDKLFWGCNLPAFTPEGKHYIPIWTADEVQLIRDILQQGLTLFTDKLRKQSV